jgi:hypothetical protein
MNSIINMKKTVTQYIHAILTVFTSLLSMACVKYFHSQQHIKFHKATTVLHYSKLLNTRNHKVTKRVEPHSMEQQLIYVTGLFIGDDLIGTKRAAL